MVKRPADRGRSAAALLLAAALLAPAFIPATAIAGRGEPGPRGSGPSRGALLVKLKPTADVASAAAAVSAAGGTEIGRLDELNTRVVAVPAGRHARARAQLLADPNVLSVEQDGQAQATVVPSDPLWTRQWSARRVRAPLAWDVTTGRVSTVVAVVDTGVDAAHPDLAGKVLPGWNFQGNNADTYDDGNHGTPVAGLIAGVANNGKGIAGICWRCQILPVKVLNSAGSGSWSNIAAGIVWAANNGADVINLSLGGPTGGRALADAVAYAIGKGVIVAAAGGNNGSRSKFYPAAYPNVLGVAATTNNDSLYSFSNRGLWLDVTAPGCTWSAAPGGTWRSFCGTSAATPIVSGIAGLVISRAPAASRRAVQAAITSTAVPIGAVVEFGRVDAAAAVRVLGSQTALPAPSASPSPSPTLAPTASPTPKPSPTATPISGIPSKGYAAWEDELWSDEDEDQRWFGIGGNVRIELRWDNHDDFRLEIDNQWGQRVFTYDDDGTEHEDHSHAELRLWLKPGWYEFEVSGDYPGETDYRVEVKWES